MAKKKRPSHHSRPEEDILEGGGYGGGIRGAYRKTMDEVDRRLERSMDSGPSGAKGTTHGGRSKRSAIIGQERVDDYTKKRRIEGAKVGGAAGVALGAAGQAAVDSMKEDKKEPKGIDLTGEELDDIEKSAAKRAMGGRVGVGKAQRGHGKVRSC